MKMHTVKCEAIQVETKSGTCVGLARTKRGETCLVDGRTPPGEGMCSNAFGALSNVMFLMMAMDKSPGEIDGVVDRVCPHGCVTFRLSRSSSTRPTPFDEKPVPAPVSTP